MATYIVHGGKTLRGTIETNTTKNSTVAILCAALMIRGTIVLEDMPHIEEVDRFLEILGSIGVTFSWTDKRTLKLDTSKDLQMDKIDKVACAKTRAALLLLGALAAREKQYKLYKTAGCKLGKRSVKPHMMALEQFGVSVESKKHYYEVKNKPLKSADIVMYESGDTTTENAIMAAVLAPGKTTIKFASSNYMVQDLCYFLVAAGAKIEGIGTTTLTITGVKKLKSVKSYAIMPDPIESMAWIALACSTKSKLTITNCPLDFLELELEKLKAMGQEFALKKKRTSKNGHFTIVDIVVKPSKLTALPDKLYGRPFPGLNIDNLPLFAPILTQAKGRTLVHDWVYENRALYLLELQKFGVQTIFLDPHRIMIEGPAKLTGNELICPPAIRPGMALLLTMIAAKGKSIMRNIYPIERAYEAVEERLRSVGVDIRRIEE